MDTIQKEIIELEKELVNIKTVQGSIKTVFGYSAGYANPDSTPLGQLDQVLELTYADGDGLILCIPNGASTVCPLPPVGNKQRFYFRILYYNEPIIFTSNREILSIEKV